jgi:hypothetical protein
MAGENETPDPILEQVTKNLERLQAEYRNAKSRVHEQSYHDTLSLIEEFLQGSESRSPGNEAMDYSCPHCGNEHTASVPMYYASGTSRTEAFSVYVGTHTNYGLVPTIARTQTLAARQLAPPSKKRSQVIGFSILGLMLMLLFPMLAVIVFHDQREWAGMEPSFVLGFTAVVGLMVGIIGAVRSRKSARAYNETVWWPLYEEWQASFLCERCGTVFRPSEAD